MMSVTKKIFFKCLSVPGFCLGALMFLVASGTGTGVLAAGSGQSTVIFHTPVSTITENQDLTVQTSFSQPMQEVYLHYKLMYEDVYMERELLPDGNSYTYTVSVPIETEAGELVQYYISAVTDAGERLTYPMYDPYNIPVYVRVVAPPKDEGFEVLPLSPDDNEKILFNDILVAFSILADEGTEIDVRKFQLKVDGKPVNANVSTEIITYAPKKMSLGKHSAVLYYGSKEVGSIKFSAIGQTSGDVFSEREFNGNAFTEWRGQSITDESTDFFRIGTDFRGRYKLLEYGATGILDSQDDDEENQPLNRYSLNVGLKSESIHTYVHLGDSYPKFNKLMLNGNRIRGFSAGAELHFLNLYWSQGNVKRAVFAGDQKDNRNAINDIVDDRIALGDSVSQINSYLAANVKDSLTFGGTFERKLYAARFSIGRSRVFDLGILNVTRVKDQKKSLGYNSINAATYTGEKPKDNLVLGSDLHLGLFEHRFQLDFGFAYSLLAEDITDEFTKKELIDKYDLPVQDVPDQFFDLFTINPSLSPLDPTQATNTAFFVTAKLNAWNNNFRFRYKNYGSDYKTLATSVQADVRGFDIYDRIRLFQNKVFLSMSLGIYEDNVSGGKANTLENTTFSSSLAIYPKPGYPNLTFTFTTLGRANDFEADDQDQIDQRARPEDNRTNLYVISSNYNFKGVGLSHTAMVNYTVSLRSDNTNEFFQDTTTNPITQMPNNTVSRNEVGGVTVPYYSPTGNVGNQTVSTSLTTNWKVPLRTTLSFSVQGGDGKNLAQSNPDAVYPDSTIKQKTSFVSFGAQADYTFVNNKDANFNSYLGFIFGSNENTVGGVKDSQTLTTYRVGSRLSFYKNHSVILNANFVTGLSIPKASDPAKTKDITNRIIILRYEYRI